jgi:lipopolysaccharide/colanic/teichoic acid biosynthesis glycosyltransferase
MAVVGPRPERPFCKEISEVMPFYETRHIINQGYYWAQVNYSYGASIDDSLIKLHTVRPISNTEAFI